MTEQRHSKTRRRGTRLQLALIVAGGLFAGLAPQALAAGAGSLDDSFSRDGRQITQLFHSLDKALAVDTTAHGKLVVVGSTRSRDFRAAAIVRYRRHGQVDRSFAHSGKKILRKWSRATAVAVQPNGDILVAGDTGTPLLTVARLHSDGTFDRSFGDGGRVRTEIAAYIHAAAVAVQPDGKIVVVGSTWGVTGGSYLFIARYRRDGQLDHTFSGDGSLVTRLGVGDCEGFGLAIQSNGKILVSGDRYGWMVARFWPNGSLDDSFGDGGIAQPGISSGTAYDIALQPNGKIVAGGAGYDDNRGFEAVRYFRNGAPDPSFSRDGVAHLKTGYLGGMPEGIGLQDDGRVVLAGTTYTAPGFDAPRFAVVRFRRNGAVDRTFAGDGKQTISMRPGPQSHRDYARDLAIQDNGRIVVVGHSRPSLKSVDFAIARFLG